MAVQKQKTNPVEALQDPRVIATGGGVAAGYFGRKALYGVSRNTFGVAAIDPATGKVGYFKPKAGTTKTPDFTQPIKEAKTNRVLLNLASLLAGTLMVTYGDEEGGDLLKSSSDSELNVKFFGLGLAGGSVVNVGITLLDLE